MAPGVDAGGEKGLVFALRVQVGPKGLKNTSHVRCKYCREKLGYGGQGGCNRRGQQREAREKSTFN